MALVQKDKTPLMVPEPIRRRAGFKPSDQLEFKASGGVITITAKPDDEDEYTPEQRREILADLKLEKRTSPRAGSTAHSRPAPRSANSSKLN